MMRAPCKLITVVISNREQLLGIEGARVTGTVAMYVFGRLCLLHMGCFPANKRVLYIALDSSGAQALTPDASRWSNSKHAAIRQEWLCFYSC